MVAGLIGSLWESKFVMMHSLFNGERSLDIFLLYMARVSTKTSKHYYFWCKPNRRKNASIRFLNTENIYTFLLLLMCLQFGWNTLGVFDTASQTIFETSRQIKSSLNLMIFDITFPNPLHLSSRIINEFDGFVPVFAKNLR